MTGVLCISHFWMLFLPDKNEVQQIYLPLSADADSTVFMITLEVFGGLTFSDEDDDSSTADFCNPAISTSLKA